MRERNKLDAGVGAIVSIERDLRDSLELADMAEAQSDERVTSCGAERSIVVRPSLAGDLSARIAVGRANRLRLR